jgi:hypothetical protein
MTEEHSSTQTQASPNSVVDETPGTGNPFPGPKPYRWYQKDLFFGRGEEIEELTSLVLSTSAVLIYAQSGSGKSSLLEAGLGPSLEGLGYRVLKPVHCNQASLTLTNGEASTPPPNPFTEIVYRTVLPEGALPQGGRDLEQLAASLRKSEGRKSTLLILDQLEGIFANQALWRERSEFLAQLRRALDANPWLRTVLAIRSDYLANLLPHERELPGQMLIRCELESLGESAAREAIELAFERTDVSLADEEMNDVLDRLLSLDVGPSGPPVRGQYVNLIQLQILCRRLWQAKKASKAKKANLGRRSDADAPDGSQVLQDSQVDLADYMQSFVSEEVANVARITQSDEGAVRRWLEDRLITPGGRRNVLLVDETAGLPPNVLDELEEARLIEVEQRNQSRYAELTHDSMVAAVQESNRSWLRTRQRARRRVTGLLLLILAGLLVLFPVLRTPTQETLLREVSGSVEGGPSRITFPLAPEGHVAVVHVSLFGTTNTRVTVGVVAKYQRKNQGRELVRSSVTPAKGGKVSTTVNFAIMTTQAASYSVIVEAPNLQSSGSQSGFLDYDVIVRSAPVILDVRKPQASRSVAVHSSLFAVKLYRNQPLYLQLNDAELEQVWGARALIRNGEGQQVVVESPGRNGYAALWIDGSSDQALPPEVSGRLAEQGPGLHLGTNADINGVGASALSIRIAKAYAPFAVDTSCNSLDGTSLDLTGSGARSVESTALSVPHNSVLVPVAHGSNYSLVLLSNTVGGELNCKANVRSFAQQKITATNNTRVRIHANSLFNAYPIRLPANSVIIVNHLNDSHASLDCLSGHITESDSNRLVAFAPRNHDCVLSIARSSNNVGRSVSFPLLIAPILGR